MFICREEFCEALNRLARRYPRIMATLAQQTIPVHKDELSVRASKLSHQRREEHVERDYPRPVTTVVSSVQGEEVHLVSFLGMLSAMPELVGCSSIGYHMTREGTVEFYVQY